MRFESDREREHASLTVGGSRFEVVELSSHEAISELFRCDLTCSGGADPGDLIGRDAEITLADGYGAERSIAGLVAEAEERVSDEGHAETRIVVRPRVFPHTLGRASRVFHDATVIDIVSRVLGEQPRWDVVSRYATHAYCVQHREDDWTFVSRMLAEEGIYAWFDGGALVLSDDSASAPELEGGAVLEFADESGMTRPRETVVEMGRVAEIAPTRFTVASFNPRNPRFEVRASAGEGPLEIYEAAGGGPESPEECARQARFRREAAACASYAVVGAAHSVRLAPGRTVQIAGHPSRLDGRYLVVASSVHVVQRRRGAGDPDRSGPLCQFRLSPASLPYRPRRAAPPAHRAAGGVGVQLGVVVGEPGAEVFPDDAGRVRVQHRWDREGARDERAGTWMRVAQRGAHDSMLIPRVGWSVATIHDEGQVDAPSVLSRLHDGEHPPSYPLPATKTRVVYKTATTPGGGSFHEVHFEDRAGGERMFWNASKDMATLVKNDRAEQVANDARRAVGRDELSDVVESHDVEIAGHRTTRVGGDETITVSGASDKVVAGDERSTIGGMRRIDVAGPHATTVSGPRTLDVGAAQIDVTVGPISASAKTVSILVGGAVVRMTSKGLSDTAGWASVQTIGAAKVERVGGSRSLSVKRVLIETAGGAMALDAKKSVTDEAKKTSTLHAGGALSAEAPAIHLQAERKITLRAGATSIEIEPSAVRITSGSFTLSDASNVIVLSPRIDNN